MTWSIALLEFLDPENILNWLGPLALIGVTFIIFAECGLLIGFFLPGDSLLFVTGLFIAQGFIKTPIWLACLILAVAAELLTGWDSGMGWTVPVVAIEPAIGVTSSRNGYVVIPFSVQNFFNATALGIGIGYQHDIPLPIRRLYATARATVSYECYQIRNGSLFNGSITHSHTAAFQPSIGVKYVLAGRVNLGIDFASIKLRIQNGLYDASYQFVGSAGVTL